MKNLSELKRLKVGDKLKLVKSYYKHRYLNSIREITVKQVNNIKLEGGSWLGFPKAINFKSTEKGFIILEVKATRLKILDIFIKRIENDKYPTRNNNNYEKGGDIAEYKGKYYFISKEETEIVEAKAESYEEKIELLEYEVIN